MQHTKWMARAAETQIDKIVVANQLDIVLVERWHKKAIGVDVAIPSDSNVRKKEHKKLKKYQGL